MFFCLLACRARLQVQQRSMETYYRLRREMAFQRIRKARLSNKVTGINRSNVNEVRSPSMYTLLETQLNPIRQLPLRGDLFSRGSLLGLLSSSGCQVKDNLRLALHALNNKKYQVRLLLRVIIDLDSIQICMSCTSTQSRIEAGS